jgi:hypothetical protein
MGGRQVGGAVSGSFDVALEGRLMVMAIFQEFSYTSHIEHSQNQLIDDSKKPLLDSWFDETTVDIGFMPDALLQDSLKRGLPPHDPEAFASAVIRLKAYPSGSGTAHMW